MPGVTLGIGETNPKQGAVQYDARRIDGVPFVIPAGAGVTKAPVGSIVTLQELNDVQKIVLGAKALTSGSSTYGIIGIGFLEAATQADASINQTPGEFVDGDIVAMISSVDVVAAVPVDRVAPAVGAVNYITVSGTLTATSGSNVIFPGSCFYGTPGVQNSGQLKTGYCFARLFIPGVVDALGGEA